jgi:hypothetical protein
LQCHFELATCHFLDFKLFQIIAKSAFVQCPPTSYHEERCIDTHHYQPSVWWDGSPICDDQTLSPPPLYIGWQWPEHCCPYYRTAFKKYAKTFTEGHGTVYRPLYEALRDTFLKPSTSPEEENDNAVAERDDSSLPSSHPFYRMIPSFFHTLVKLQEMNIDYTLVLRTFGTDLGDIAFAIRDFANGKHPLYPSFREPKLLLDEGNMYQGRYRVGNVNGDGDDSINGSGNGQSLTDSSIYDLFDWNDSLKMVASGDDELLKIIESQSICGIQDDYKYWSSNNCVPSCGKPVWIHPQDEDVRVSYHHIFFDDNIHNDADDSIVAVRSRDAATHNWQSLSGEKTIEQQGKSVVRVPTVAAILQKDWYLQQIAMAEANLHGY